MTACGVGVEADLDVLDEHGAVVLAVRGLQLGTGASQASERARVLGERLLGIEWHERELPENSHAEPGAWLLISTSAAADLLATELTDALKLREAQCTTMSWPQRADHAAQAARLRDQLGTGGFTGVRRHRHGRSPRRCPTHSRDGRGRGPRAEGLRRAAHRRR
nr:hypothetical protein [Mycobacterium canetti]